jgi:DNA-binding NarL/FixJ family response regulator
MVLRVVLADDNYLVRQGLSALLAEADGVDVVATASEPSSLLMAVDDHTPDAVLTDIRMPPTHTTEGIAAAEEIRRRHPGTGVLVLSQYLEARYAMQLVGGSAGGVGYLLKDRVADGAVLHDAVRRVAAGDCVVDPSIVAKLVGRRRKDDPLESLTRRERDVLVLMAEGKSNAAIAAELFVTHSTVEAHIKNVFDKLGLELAPETHRRVLAVLTLLRGRE